MCSLVTQLSGQWGHNMMNKELPKANYNGFLMLGDKKIACAVLEDGTRVLTQQGFLKAIGRARSAKGGTGATVDNRVAFLSANNLKPFISKELEESTTPIRFQTVKGIEAFGYKAELLPEVCNVYLEAREAEKLLPNQSHIAKICEIIVRALANVGIIALIDEATGYQFIRDRLALQTILERYISKELMKWQKRFPDEWYENLFRLHGWEWKGREFNPPQIVGKITNEIIYERLPKGVLEELKSKNPPIDEETGRRKFKFHQWLTPEIGHPKLQEIITGTNTLMKISPNWRKFKEHLVRAFPKFGDQTEMDLDS
jgi:hypothetical protein